MLAKIKEAFNNRSEAWVNYSWSKKFLLGICLYGIIASALALIPGVNVVLGVALPIVSGILGIGALCLAPLVVDICGRLKGKRFYRKPAFYAGVSLLAILTVGLYPGAFSSVGFWAPLVALGTFLLLGTVLFATFPGKNVGGDGRGACAAVPTATVVGVGGAAVPTATVVSVCVGATAVPTATVVDAGAGFGDGDERSDGEITNFSRQC